MNTHSRAEFIDEQSSGRCTAEHHEDLDRADPSDLRLRLVTELMFLVVFLEDTKGIHEAHTAEECEETSDETEASTMSLFHVSTILGRSVGGVLYPPWRLTSFVVVDSASMSDENDSLTWSCILQNLLLERDRWKGKW